MPNAVAMTKSVDAGMNLRRSTEPYYRRQCQCRSRQPEAGAGPDPPFITAEAPFITGNVPGWSPPA